MRNRNRRDRARKAAAGGAAKWASLLFSTSSCIFYNILISDCFN